MVHHKGTPDKSHHKSHHESKKDVDSPHQLHERLTIDDIMHKEFGYAEEYKDTKEKIQEVKLMNYDDREEFITNKKGKAYDQAMQEILVDPEAHDHVVDQEEAERERRERVERDILTNSPIRNRAQKHEAQGTGNTSAHHAKECGGDFEEICCCFDRRGSDSRSCPNKRPPKGDQLEPPKGYTSHHDAPQYKEIVVHRRSRGGPRYKSRENRMPSPPPNPTPSPPANRTMFEFFFSPPANRTRQTSKSPNPFNRRHS